MNAFIPALLIAFYVFAPCTAELNAGELEKVQEAGEELAQRIKNFNKLTQDVIFSCFDEAYQVMQSSVKFLIKNQAPTLKAVMTQTAPMEDAGKLKEISDFLNQQIENGIREEQKQFYLLLKKAAVLLVNDDIVVNKLLGPNLAAKLRRSPLSNSSSLSSTVTATDMNSIDGKILSLQKEMTTSLMNIENNLQTAGKKLFTMFADSLKMLYADPAMKKRVEESKVQLEEYLRGNMDSVMRHHLEHFFRILKEASQQIEMIDSLVKEYKNDNQALMKALEPAKSFIDDAIRHVKEVTGEGLKKRLADKIQWMKEAFAQIKSSTKA